MAVAYGSTTTATGSVSELTIVNHTVTGANPTLIVCVCYKSSSATVTSVYWNGTELMAAEVSNVGGDATSYILSLANPTATTANVVITIGGTVRVVACASTYTGVHQSDPVVNTNSATGTDANPTITCSPNPASDTMVVDSMAQVSAGPYAVSSQSGDSRLNDFYASGGTDTRGCSQDTTGDGTEKTMSYTMAGSEDWAICYAVLQEPGAAPSAYPGWRPFGHYRGMDRHTTVIR